MAPCAQKVSDGEPNFLRVKTQQQKHIMEGERVFNYK